MTRITIFLLMAAILLVLSGLAAVHREPQARPYDPGTMVQPETARPVAAAAAAALPPTMPEPYRVLLNRSVFARDGRAAVRASFMDRGSGNAPGLWIGPPGTEATLVFRGVTLSNGSYTAYIEDMTGGGVRRFGRGDPIAAGRITGITLDAMDYESGRKVTTVALGQTLGGADAAATTAPAAAPTTSPVSPEGGEHRHHGRHDAAGHPPGTGSDLDPAARDGPQ